MNDEIIKNRVCNSDKDDFSDEPKGILKNSEGVFFMNKKHDNPTDSQNEDSSENCDGRENEFLTGRAVLVPLRRLKGGQNVRKNIDKNQWEKSDKQQNFEICLLFY